MPTEVVPAPMREEGNRIGQPLDLAGTYRKAALRVPAPMRGEVSESAQPLDRAWTNRMATIRVPAPRLELGTP
jgi:hypothetical protein